MNKNFTILATHKSLAGDCPNGVQCPTLYLSKTGKFYIKGYKTASTTKRGLDVADNEDIVEISKELVDSFKQLKKTL